MQQIRGREVFRKLPGRFLQAHDPIHLPEGAYHSYAGSVQLLMNAPTGQRVSGGHFYPSLRSGRPFESRQRKRADTLFGYLLFWHITWQMIHSAIFAQMDAATTRYASGWFKSSSAARTAAITNAENVQSFP